MLPIIREAQKAGARALRELAGSLSGHSGHRTARRTGGLVENDPKRTMRRLRLQRMNDMMIVIHKTETAHD
jgi:hypothetical protein